MVYHIPPRVYEIYETHPATGVEIVIAPKGAGNLESLAGVNSILNQGYKLVCYKNSTSSTEVLQLKELDKEKFRASFKKGEVAPWIAPLKVGHLKIS